MSNGNQDNPLDRGNLASFVASLAGEIEGKNLHISEMEKTLYHVSTEQNIHTAAVGLNLATTHGTTSGIGMATSEQCGTTDPRALIRDATAEAFRNAVDFTSLLDQSQIRHNTSSAQDDRGNVNLNQSVSRQGQTGNSQAYRHNPNKPASDSQIGLINRLCNQQNISKQDAKTLAHIDPDKPLNSQTANMLIQTLRDKAGWK